MSKRREHEQALLGRVEHLFERIVEVLEEISHSQREILHRLNHPPITSFQIKENTMPLITFAPGNAPQFTATPNPAGAVPTTPPTWISSDPVNAPVTVDETGLIATVNIPEDAVVGTQFTLQVHYVNPDGEAASGTSDTLTIVAAETVIDITSFTITQTA